MGVEEGNELSLRLTRRQPSMRRHCIWLAAVHPTSTSTYGAHYQIVEFTGQSFLSFVICIRTLYIMAIYPLRFPSTAHTEGCLLWLPYPSPWATPSINIIERPSFLTKSILPRII